MRFESFQGKPTIVITITEQIINKKKVTFRKVERQQHI